MRHILLALLLLPTIVFGASGISIPPVVKILELKPFTNVNGKLEIRYISAERPNDRIVLVAANKEVEIFLNDFVKSFNAFGLNKLYCDANFELGQITYPFIVVKSIKTCVDEEGNLANDAKAKLNPSEIANSLAFIANSRKEKYPLKEVNDSTAKKEVDKKPESSAFSDEYLKRLLEKKKKEETSEK